MHWLELLVYKELHPLSGCFRWSLEQCKHGQSLESAHGEGGELCLMGTVFYENALEELLILGI